MAIIKRSRCERNLAKWRERTTDKYNREAVELILNSAKDQFYTDMDTYRVSVLTLIGLLKNGHGVPYKGLDRPHRVHLTESGEVSFSTAWAITE